MTHRPYESGYPPARGGRHEPFHRHNVTEKMQVQSLAELVSLAERVGVHELAAGQTSLGISDRQVPQCEDRSPPPR